MVFDALFCCSKRGFGVVEPPSKSRAEESDMRPPIPGDDGASLAVPDIAPEMAKPNKPQLKQSLDTSSKPIMELIQELSSSSSNRNRILVIPEAMALLCTKLDVTWACLTAFSSTCQHFQHCGAAHVMPVDKKLRSIPAFSALCAAGRSSNSHFSYSSLNMSREESREESREQGSESGAELMPPYPVSNNFILPGMMQ